MTKKCSAGATAHKGREVTCTIIIWRLENICMPYTQSDLATLTDNFSLGVKSKLVVFECVALVKLAVVLDIQLFSLQNKCACIKHNACKLNPIAERLALKMLNLMKHNNRN